MGLENRLRDLLAAERADLAESLATGVLGSQEVQSVSLTAEGVRLETQSFVGTHELCPTAQRLRQGADTADKDRVSLADVTVGPATYRLKSDDLEFSVTTTHVNHDAIRTHLAQFCTVEDDESGHASLDDRKTDMATAKSRTPPPNNQPEAVAAENESTEPAARPTSAALQPSTPPAAMADGGKDHGMVTRIRQVLSRYLWGRDDSS